MPPKTVAKAAARGESPERLAERFEGGGVQTPMIDPIDLLAGFLGGGLLSRGASLARAGAPLAKASPKAAAEAGLRLGEAMPLRSGVGAVHSIFSGGSEIGLVKVIPGGTKLRIDTIQGTGAGTLGTGAVKNLMKQLKAAYPGVKQVTGLRTTGINPMRTATVGIR